MTLGCPVTIDNVFSAPSPKDVKMFYDSRCSHGSKDFAALGKAPKLAWTEACHDNKALMGYIV